MVDQQNLTIQLVTILAAEDKDTGDTTAVAEDTDIVEFLGNQGHSCL